jgi:small subunit ribosomal protein S6
MTTTPEVAKELDRQLGLNEAVLRTKLLRPDAA